MIRKLFACSLLFAGIASAENYFGSYLGPGILRGGNSDAGSRTGEAVDLRFYIGANGVIDTGYQGNVTNGHDVLIRPGTLTGVALTGGVYGIHKWKNSQLKLDYSGDVRHYPGAGEFDTTSHNLSMGYSYQPNSRVVYDLRLGATEYTHAAYGSFADGTDPAAIEASSLLDTRYFGVTTGGTVTYLYSARTSFTFGGGGNYQTRRVPDSFKTHGYNAVGSVNHRLSARTSVGVDYMFSHDQAHDNSFDSAVHMVLGRYVLQVGPSWTINLGAGVFIANIDQRLPFHVGPELAIIFGTDTVIIPVQLQKIGPSGNFAFTWQKRRNSFSFSGTRSVVGGGSTYLTSTNESAGVTYRFTAARKWSAWINLGGYRTTGIGTQFVKYTVGQGGVGFNYALYPAVHLVATYDVRRQNVIYTGFSRTPSTTTFGIMFSPGSLPLSFR